MKIKDKKIVQTRRGFLKIGAGASGTLLSGLSLQGCSFVLRNKDRGNESNGLRFKFAHVVDTHISTQEKNGAAMKADSIRIFEDVVDRLNETDGLDFILFWGDNFDNNEKGIADLDEFMRLAEKLNALYFIQLGNRESSSSPQGDPVSKEQFVKKFQGLNLNDDDEKCLKSVGKALLINGFPNRQFSNPIDAIDAFKSERFDSIHSIKGASGFFGLEQIGKLSHIMENLLSLLRDGKIPVTPELTDVLLVGVYALRTMVDDVTTSEELDIQCGMCLEMLKRTDLFSNQEIEFVHGSFLFIFSDGITMEQISKAVCKKGLAPESGKIKGTSQKIIDSLIISGQQEDDMILIALESPSCITNTGIHYEFKSKFENVNQACNRAAEEFNKTCLPDGSDIDFIFIQSNRKNSKIAMLSS